MSLDASADDDGDNLKKSMEKSTGHEKYIKVAEVPGVAWVNKLTTANPPLQMTDRQTFLFYSPI